MAYLYQTHGALFILFLQRNLFIIAAIMFGKIYLAQWHYAQIRNSVRENRKYRWIITKKERRLKWSKVMTGDDAWQIDCLGTVYKLLLEI